MEKKIQDYLHFYLGVECRTNDREMGSRMHYGRVGTFLGFADHHKLDCRLGFRTGPEGRCNVFMLKPLLRPLSSMTEEERLEMFLLKGLTKPDKVLRTNIEDRFIQIEYKHDGFIASDYQHIITMYPQQFLYLLSRGFDLFGLIEAGLAIDKTQSPQ